MLRTRTAVARILGIHMKTIGLWEKDGIVRPPQRDNANRRLYSDQDIEELKGVAATRQSRRKPTR
jgi:DNA-binding transcriptional MerR regulator